MQYVLFEPGICEHISSHLAVCVKMLYVLFEPAPNAVRKPYVCRYDIRFSYMPYVVYTRGRIRFEFEMVFKWPIFGLFLNRIFESNQIFYTYCNRVRIRRQSQSSEKKGT
jgi:hypothetical protein